MKRFALIVLLIAVLVGTVVAQDDGKVDEKLHSIKKAETQAPEKDSIALARSKEKEKQIKNLESFLAKAQDDDDDGLVDVQDESPPGAQDFSKEEDALLADSQWEDEDLQNIIASLQQGDVDDGDENAMEEDDKHFLKHLLAGEQETATEQQDDDDDEEVLAQDFHDHIKKQIFAEKQDLDSSSATAQTRKNTRSTQQFRCLANHYKKHYAQHYSKYYKRYYSKYYNRYYVRHYSRYYSRYYNRLLNSKKSYYANYYSRYYKRYYNKKYQRYYSNYYWRHYRRSCNRRRTYWSG